MPAVGSIADAYEAVRAALGHLAEARMEVERTEEMLAGLVHAAVQPPDYYSRADWGASAGQGAPTPGGLRLVVIHHTVSPDLPPSATPAQEQAAVRGIEAYHAAPKPEGNGWDGIGYNWLVCPSGRVYEGRGWRRAGAHTAGKNSESVGVAFLQHGGTRALTMEELFACRELLRAGVEEGHLAADYVIDGHRDHAATECPGDLIYPRIQALR